MNRPTRPTAATQASPRAPPHWPAISLQFELLESGVADLTQHKDGLEQDCWAGMLSALSRLWD